MKSTIKTAAWICAILLVSVSCYDDGTDCFDTATRISLYPDVELFNADGTTASGNESFVSAVTVNVGPAVSDMAWEASVPASAAWATVRRTTVASIFEEAAGGARHDLSADGIELVLQPNTEYRRTVVVTIAAADGTTADYEFTQLGQKADAAVTSETAQLVFMAAGGSETVTYTSNMGDAYAYEVVYGEGSADWLTVGDGGVGTLTLTASQWDDQERPRAATLRIVVGSADTSMATLEIPVTQNAAYDYYYMYGASADALAVGDAYELTRKAAGEYTGTLYFLRSADGGNPVLLNKNGRTVSYPCYALTKEGTVAEIPTAETQLPAGPDIDIDGVRRFTVDFNAMTWSWERVTTPNCMPDTEVSAYPTKAYVTRDGGTKTWMTVGLHWAGDATIGRYKLGSGLVSGHQTGGYGNEAPYASRNPAYDTEENGGSIVEAKDGSGRPLAETYGRLYSSYESLTGSANGALNACEGGKNALINSPIGEPGSTLVDAVGDRYVLESIMPADLAVYAATAAGRRAGRSRASQPEDADPGHLPLRLAHRQHAGLERPRLGGPCAGRGGLSRRCRNGHLPRLRRRYADQLRCAALHLRLEHLQSGLSGREDFDGGRRFRIQHVQSGLAPLQDGLRLRSGRQRSAHVLVHPAHRRLFGHEEGRLAHLEPEPRGQHAHQRRIRFRQRMRRCRAVRQELQEVMPDLSASSVRPPILPLRTDRGYGAAAKRSQTNSMFKKRKPC